MNSPTPFLRDHHPRRSVLDALDAAIAALGTGAPRPNTNKVTPAEPLAPQVAPVVAPPKALETLAGSTGATRATASSGSRVMDDGPGRAGGGQGSRVESFLQSGSSGSSGTIEDSQRFQRGHFGITSGSSGSGSPPAPPPTPALVSRFSLASGRFPSDPESGASWRAWISARADIRWAASHDPEASAFSEAIEAWCEMHSADYRAGCCAACHQPLAGRDIIALGAGVGVHADGGWACWLGYGRQRHHRAALALEALGVLAPAGWTP